MKNTARNKGFTLIELLVVMVIMALLAAIAIFGVQGARQSGRDSKRKTDLSNVSTALELYKSDCNSYPNAAAGNKLPSTIQGTGTPASCDVSNVYMNNVPEDASTGNFYKYIPGASNATYVLCTALEDPPNPAMAGIGACSGNCGTDACNYFVQSP